MVWKKIAEKNAIESGKGQEFIVDGKKIAIFNKDGYHAIDGVCAHQDGTLALGKIEGDVLECPDHFWHYNIKSGELLDYLKNVKLNTYKVEEKDDGIYIDF